MAELVGHHPGCGCVVGSYTEIGIDQVESGVVASESGVGIEVGESPERMIEEVEGLGPELKGFRFADLEILEDGEITVGEQRTMDVRDAVVAVVGHGG